MMAWFLVFLLFCNLTPSLARTNSKSSKQVFNQIDDDKDQILGKCASPDPPNKFRIVGGREVSPRYKYPYQVYFRANGQRCGGSLVSARHVVTAAHCLYDPRGVQHPPYRTSVVLGEHDIQDGLKNEGGQIVRVKEFIEHPQYDFPRYDLAVLVLSNDVNFTSNVRRVCLPCSNSSSYAGEAGAVAGWGSISYKPAFGEAQPPNISNVLMETMIEVLQPDEPRCQVYDGWDGSILMCGYSENTDICQGDSGGGLTVVESGYFTLIGVVAGGRGCAAGWPSIYTRVNAFADWIREKVTSRKEDCVENIENDYTSDDLTSDLTENGDNNETDVNENETILELELETETDDDDYSLDGLEEFDDVTENELGNSDEVKDDTDDVIKFDDTADNEDEEDQGNITDNDKDQNETTSDMDNDENIVFGMEDCDTDVTNCNIDKENEVDISSDNDLNEIEQECTTKDKPEYAPNCKGWKVYCKSRKFGFWMRKYCPGTCSCPKKNDKKVVYFVVE